MFCAFPVTKDGSLEIGHPIFKDVLSPSAATSAGELYWTLLEKQHKSRLSPDLASISALVYFIRCNGWNGIGQTWHLLQLYVTSRPSRSYALICRVLERDNKLGVTRGVQVILMRTNLVDLSVHILINDWKRTDKHYIASIFKVSFWIFIRTFRQSRGESDKVIP